MELGRNMEEVYYKEERKKLNKMNKGMCPRNLWKQIKSSFFTTR